MIGLSRLERAIADVPKGGMQTGSHKVVLKLADAERIKIEMNHLITERDALASEVKKLTEAIKAVISDCQACSYDDETGWFVGSDVISDAEHLVFVELEND